MEKSSFFDAEQDALGNYDREYLAKDFAAYFSRFISNGVFPNPSTGLEVSQAAEPNMTVSLAPGFAYINGYTYENTSPKPFKIDVADGQLNRDDAIFVRFDSLGRLISSKLVKGSPSSAAVPPAIIRTEDYWDLCVAIIHVKAGVSQITDDLIEDTRMDTHLCGIVTSVVQSVDTTTLYKQIQADLNRFQTESQADFDSWSDAHKAEFNKWSSMTQAEFEVWMSENKGAFDAWFEDINSKLGTAPATALQEQVNSLFDATRGAGEVFSGQKFYGKLGKDRIESIAVKGKTSQLGSSDPSPNNIRPIIGVGMPVNQQKPITSFELTKDYSLDVKSLIEPVQEGSGDPSPDNVRPIKGFTEVKLVRCGKNILKSAVAQQSVNGIAVLPNDDGSFQISGTASARTEITIASNFLLKEGTYISSFSKEIILQTNKGYISTASGGKLIVDSDRKVFNLSMRIESGSAVNETIYPQLELGPIATPYEPYQGNEYTVQFGQTVYGGSYDWDKGELTLTHKVFELKVSDMNNNEDFPGWNNVSGIGADTGLGDGTSYQQVQSNVGRSNVNTQSGNKTIFMSKGIYNLTQSEWKKQYPNLTIQVLMPYRKGAYPVIKLTPQQILALSGTNNLYSDTGNTWVQTKPFTLIKVKDSSGEHLHRVDLSAPLFEGGAVTTNTSVGGRLQCVENRKTGFIVINGVDNHFKVSLGDSSYWNLYLGREVENTILNAIPSSLKCTHFSTSSFGISSGNFIYTSVTKMSPYGISSVEQLNAYCKRQYDAGQPVCILYTKTKFESTLTNPILTSNAPGWTTVELENEGSLRFWALTDAKDLNQLQNVLDETWSLSGGILIPEGTDLNNVIRFGNYRVPFISTAQSLANCPVSSAFTMKVTSGIGTRFEPTDDYRYYIQILIPYNFNASDRSVMYMRQSIGSSSVEEGALVWSEWFAVTTKKELNEVENKLTNAIAATNTAVTKAQNTADTANTAAHNAQTSANNAQSTADAAQSDAGRAQSTANSALDKANAAIPKSGAEIPGLLGNANGINVQGRWFRNITVVNSGWVNVNSQWITLVRK